ncbi:rod shape-determining protein MreD [Flavivirga rizhaonensis]|uniref:Rod shape-determining protein MreD n=1 Tax=Flavivirga rizhaonensis TaxID=2559571 RepID=A0A4S1DWH8_9FLAO|nr:rod shape-determining protein MreD [Flavivirga rizhaonensis]TGV02480.1 rod shape-determining protein MreD [Flavivirga rizhaonensis]
MNNLLSVNSVRFIVLVLIQVLVFNNINFWGYINPYPYILFIAFFPVKSNRVMIILSGFLLGLIIDMFMDSGGIHAAACVFIAYVRPVILKFSFGTMYEHHNMKFGAVEFGSKITYITLIVSIHHIILFSLEIFSLPKIILVLQKTLFSGIFTILLCIIITIIFSRKSK